MIDLWRKLIFLLIISKFVDWVFGYKEGFLRFRTMSSENLNMFSHFLVYLNHMYIIFLRNFYFVYRLFGFTPGSKPALLLILMFFFIFLKLLCLPFFNKLVHPKNGSCTSESGTRLKIRYFSYFQTNF